MIKFGTGGFRGVINEDFNKNNVMLIAQAISNIIINNNLKKEVVIGYDYRELSLKLQCGWRRYFLIMEFM